MKLTVLGSSHGVPEANRKCSSIMIEVSDRYYFIDIGTPIVDELAKRNISINKVKSIFVTHTHGDHLNGFFQFADLISWYYTDVKTEIFLPKMSVAKVIQDWTDTLGYKCLAKMNEIKEGIIFNDGYVEVIAIPTMHCEKSYAFIFKAEGKTILFSGDLKNPKIDFPKYAMQNKIDLMVCEAAHFSVEDYIPVFSQCTARQIVFNHYTSNRIPGILDLQKNMCDRSILLATDNMEIVV